MSRIIRSGLIQMSLPLTEGEGSIAEIKEAIFVASVEMIMPIIAKVTIHLLSNLPASFTGSHSGLP